MKTPILSKALIFLFIMGGIILQAQEKNLFIILKKGTATASIHQTKLSDIPVNKREELPLHASLMLSAGSVALVYNRNGSMEIGSSRAEKYQTDVLYTTLNKREMTTATSRFFEFLNQTYHEMKKKAEFCGSVTGAANRGSSNFYYSPNDSSIIISDTVKLIYGPDEYYKTIQNLIVVNISREDTLYNARVNSSVIFSGLKEGEYHWSTMIRTEEGKLMKMDNIFYVPVESKRKIMMDDLLQFREMISSFSDETRGSLLEEYLRNHNIYCLQNGLHR